EKLAICKEKGADELVNYTEVNLKDKLKELTEGKGVDVVYDPVGDKFAEPAIRSMAWKGRYLVVGFAGGEIPKIPLNLALLKGCDIVGVFWGRFAATEPAMNMQNIQELAGNFMKGTLKPHIYKTYDLADAPQALEDLMNRKVIGKAVITTSDDAFDKGQTVAIKQPKSVEIEVTPQGGKFTFASLNALKAHEGKSLGTSAWQTVSQEMINEFASATFDNQWIHVDAEKAAASPFGGTIAHGLLTLSLTPKFIYELFEVSSSQMGVNYGMNKVRFISPVPSGSKLRLSAVLKSVEMKQPNVAKLLIEATIELENSEKPACVAELLSVIYE
ncbi:MAG: MaoC/PaaZ C-terminal domain-containing protein, partial [Spirosomaceae bacterium]|nr:MaoC/PaaZ C-terminal domain-containing protein [Spirosomataceae bacterium]